MRQKIIQTGILVVASLLLAGFNAQPAPSTMPEGKAADIRISNHLRQLYNLKSRAAVGPSISGSIALRAERIFTLREDRILIDAVAEQDAAELLDDLQEMGLAGGVAYGRMVSGELPIASLPELAGLKSLRYAIPALMRTRAGLVTSQGDPAMRADLARRQFGVDGSGVTVGVLSDTYNDFDLLIGRPATDAETDVINGDLPANVQVLDDTAGPGFDEGRAMMQLIHDVAPGADLAFHTAFKGQADFALGIIELALIAGADVIVDDVIYFAEPMFQDGIIAQAVDIVKSMGVAYFSSAGNQGRDAYGSRFRDSGIPGFFDDLNPGNTARHDFKRGPKADVFQTFTVGGGEDVIFSLQWDQPFFSLTGTVGSQNDMDLLFYDMQGNLLPFSSPDSTLIVLQGFSDNIESGDPVELAEILNLGDEPVQVQIGIELFAGHKPKRMKYVYFRQSSGTATEEYAIPAGTIYGHPNASGAMAVGAAFYFETPAFGTRPPLLEPFSSAGITPILFQPDGTRTFRLRFKPEIVAPDGTNTTFFIPGIDPEGDGFFNFFGTSAAAPHAAAVAALMLEASADLSVDRLNRILKKTAVDMDDPLTPWFDRTFDFATGYGLINAEAALKNLTRR
jgi:subtilisin family serine protease